MGGEEKRRRRHSSRNRFPGGKHEFSEACEKAGILFIGPTADVIRNTGNKIAARELMEKAGIPVIPGTKALPHGSAARQGSPGLREGTRLSHHA